MQTLYWGEAKRGLLQNFFCTLELVLQNLIMTEKWYLCRTSTNTMTDIELAPSMFLDKNDETRNMFAYFELNFFATAFWQLSFLSNSNKKASIIYHYNWKALYIRWECIYCSCLFKNCFEFWYWRNWSTKVEKLKNENNFAKSNIFQLNIPIGA